MLPRNTVRDVRIQGHVLNVQQSRKTQRTTTYLIVHYMAVCDLNTLNPKIYVFNERYILYCFNKKCTVILANEMWHNYKEQ